MKVPHGQKGLVHLPAAGRLLGVDLGTVRVGLAITDSEQRVATPLETRPAHETIDDQADDIAQVAAEHEVAGVVVGYPRTLAGREGPEAAHARRIAAAVGASVPTILWDERFTTVEAERVMLDQDASRRERRAHIDRVAACVLLDTVVAARRHA